MSRDETKGQAEIKTVNTSATGNNQLTMATVVQLLRAVKERCLREAVVQQDVAEASTPTSDPNI